MRSAFFMALVLMPIAANAQLLTAPPGATTCSGCHGAGGMVGITGRDPAAMVTQLEAYRSGAQPATLMNRLVRGFSPAEIQAIAQWLSVQR
jgi:cytochrome c553